MKQKIDRSDTDFNTIQWQDDQLTIVRQSDTHVQISRYRHLMNRPFWSIAVDVTSGHRMLHVAGGNRLACVANQHLLALTCGEYASGGSLHNYQLHYIHESGRILWSRPWHTIQRFTTIDEKLLVLRYPSPPHYWIVDVPLEAHLLDPETGESVQMEPIAVPDELKEHYQSWQVTELKTYLVWKNGKLIVTVRPYFHSHYEPAHTLVNRGSFKHILSFDGVLPPD